MSFDTHSRSLPDLRPASLASDVERVSLTLPRDLVRAGRVVLRDASPGSGAGSAELVLEGLPALVAAAALGGLASRLLEGQHHDHEYRNGEVRS